LTPEEMDDLQRFLQDRVNEMVDIGEQLKREREDKEKSQPKRGVLATLFPTFFKKRSTTIRQFKMAVYLLEQDVRDYTAYSIKNEKYNPLYPYIAFFFGIISAIVSLCWILQTLLYTLPNNPVAGFLNNFFEWFDSWFPLFGLLAVAFFTLYLLLCVIKGCFVFGLRFICISFFPMKVGETYMSSFLFNMCLVLLSALPVVNFSVVSFSDYAKHSTIYNIFEVQVDNLSFFGFFFDNDIFIYILLIVALLTGVILNCRHKQRGQEGIKLQNRLKSRARFVSSSEENTAHVSIPAAPTTTPTSTIDEIENEVFEDEPAPLLLRQQTTSDDDGYSVGSNISG
jgi:LMBR1 domain-containing protein 1